MTKADWSVAMSQSISVRYKVIKQLVGPVKLGSSGVEERLTSMWGIFWVLEFLVMTIT